MTVRVNPNRSEKYCPRCKRFLPRSAFRRCSGHADGMKAYCKECMSKDSNRILAISDCCICGDPAIPGEHTCGTCANNAQHRTRSGVRFSTLTPGKDFPDTPVIDLFKSTDHE